MRQPFVLKLGAILAVGLILRLVYALVAAPGTTLLDDDTFFHLTANLLADGRGFVRPLELVFEGRSLPTAEHPPLYPALLSLIALLGGTGEDVQRLVGVLAGTATVGVVALVARRLRGDVAGLSAAAIGALYPSFIAADGALMSETLLGTLVALALLLALRGQERPGIGAAAALGALVALATLTRSEAILLLPLLAAPAVLAARRRRLLLGGAAGVALLVVLTPWVVRNWTQFDRPLLSNNDGSVIAGSYCPRTFDGPQTGWFVFECTALSPPEAGDEAVRAQRLRSQGVDYAREHAGRLPLLGAVHVGHLWGLYEPRRQATVTGRARWIQRLGVIAYYPMALLALAGAWSLRRRRGVLVVLLAPALVATLTALLTYGTVRFRHGAEVAFLVLAGVACARLAERRRSQAPPAYAAGSPAASGSG